MCVTKTTEYHISCPGTSSILYDNDSSNKILPLESPDSSEPALLRSVYKQKQFVPDLFAQGIYKMACWLPVQRRIPTSSIPKSYTSSPIAKHLGLDDLVISFSGYWPERACTMMSASFKECEAQAVCSRFPSSYFTSEQQLLVLASAGNTARAFITVCADVKIPVIIVIPEQNLAALWSVKELAPWVHILAVQDGDYYDAIRVAEKLTVLEQCIPEGGTKNIARRDGMALTTLCAVLERGRIPDHYFQAIASGGGAIAAWETNERLLQDGRWGNTTMKLHLAQNSPFLLVVDSWKRGQRELLPLSNEKGREQSSRLFAPILSNRKPAYSLRGGLYDALTVTDGCTYAVENKEAQEASRLFFRLEGIDIDPAAAVAFASLLQAIEQQTVSKKDCILLNITGGGAKRLQKDYNPEQILPSLILPRKELEDMSASQILSTIKEQV